MAIERSCNLFSQHGEESLFLFNIASGKAAPKICEDYLCEAGKNLRMKFENECIEDQTRFQKVVARRKVCNIAKAGVSSSRKVLKAQQCAEAMRHSFSQLLLMVIEKANIYLIISCLFL